MIRFSLARALATWRSWWQFVVVERVGYRRESIITPHDHELREARDQKLNQLEVLLVLLNVKTDLSHGPHKRRT